MEFLTYQNDPFRSEIETLGYYLLFPVLELAQLLNLTISWWWVMTIGLVTYVTLSAWLNHIHHYRRLSEASQRIDQYADEVEKTHPALANAS